MCACQSLRPYTEGHVVFAVQMPMQLRELPYQSPFGRLRLSANIANNTHHSLAGLARKLGRERKVGGFQFTHSSVVHQTPSSAAECISNSKLDRIKQHVNYNVV